MLWMVRDLREHNKRLWCFLMKWEEVSDGKIWHHLFLTFMERFGTTFSLNVTVLSIVPNYICLFSNNCKQQQLSHLSQVFGGRLHEPKENYAGSGTWISFLHSFLSSNMPSLRPLTSISCRITSIHVFFGLPCAILTCPKLICSTRRTGASVDLRRT